MKVKDIEPDKTIKFFPTNSEDFLWIKRHGVIAWFTFATVEQTCDIAALTWWQKLARKIWGSL